MPNLEHSDRDLRLSEGSAVPRSVASSSLAQLSFSRDVLADSSSTDARLALESYQHAPEQCSSVSCSHGRFEVDISKVDPQSNRPIEPGDLYWISNYQSNISVSAHNGMQNDAKARTTFLNTITQLGGRDVIQVVNETAGFFRDLANSVLGTLSSRLGLNSERKAVRDQMRVIEEHLLQGGELCVSLSEDRCNVYFSKELEGQSHKRQIEYPHSQGAINTANALFLLRSKYLAEDRGQEKWDKIAGRVHVYSFGAGGHIWPEGVDVRSYAHEGDAVAKWTFRANMLTALWRGVLWGDAQLVKPVYLSNKSKHGDHSIEGYRDDFSRFFVEEHRHDPAALASRLIHTIKQGYHPDHLHAKIIDQILDGQETYTTGALFWRKEQLSPTARNVYKAAFARHFLNQLKEGSIDNFQVPRLDDIKALTE